MRVWHLQYMKISCEDRPVEVSINPSGPVDNDEAQSGSNNAEA